MAIEGRITTGDFAFAVGVPRDIGWAVATVHEDDTVTRTCKSCGVTSRDPILPGNHVAGVFIHKPECQMVVRIFGS